MTAHWAAPLTGRECCELLRCLAHAKHRFTRTAARAERLGQTKAYRQRYAAAIEMAILHAEVTMVAGGWS